MTKYLTSILFAIVVASAASASAHARCIAFLDMGGYWVVQNSCNRTVIVRWVDQQHCGSGCAARVGPGGRQSVTAPRGRYTWREQLE